MSEAPKLTSNDLALALQAASHAINWCRSQPDCDYVRGQLRAYQDLYKKLDAAADHNNPYVNTDDMPGDWGDDPIYAPITDS